ncbi:hypothetical protein JCM8115_002826 [Rhodotorula mucilaginosa]
MYSPSASPASSAASEAPPYASTSTTGRRKRTAADVDYAALDAPDAEEDNALEAGGNAQQRPTKRRAPRSTAAEKQARKVARMERNRIAAQVSRDKKKQQQELLEARIAELEAATTTSPVVLQPSPPVVTVVDPQLKEENEALKTQLALEKLHSQSLQIRLAALESKFSRLEQLLSGQLSPRSTRGRFIPAAEAVLPAALPVFSEPSSSSSSLSSSVPLDAVDGSILLTPAATAATASDFSPFDELGTAAADFDFSLGSAFEGALVQPSEPARDSGVDSSPLFGVDSDQLAGFDGSVGPLFSSADVSQAWFNWAVTATPVTPRQPVVGGDHQGDFDLVAFLQDHQQQPEDAIASDLPALPLTADAMAF